MSEKIQKNVFGEPLEPCSNDPLTGWFRDGCCNTDKNDRGVHTVCAKVTDEFLQWSRKVGNFDQAEKFYLEGLKIKPNHNGINEYLGELYVQTNQIDKANERLAVLKNCNCDEYNELQLIIKNKGVKVY